MEGRIIELVNRIHEDGVFIIGLSRGNPTVIPLHLALVTMPTMDEIIGIIRTLDALIVGCTLADPWKGLARELAGMTLISDRSATGIQAEVRKDNGGWTVYGLVPVHTDRSRRHARAARSGMIMDSTSGQIVQHGHAYAIGGVSAKLHAMGLAPGDDVTVGIFRRI